MMRRQSSRTFLAFAKYFWCTIIFLSALAYRSPVVFSQIGENEKSTGNSNKIDFTTQIRPILSAHCFACHGPEEESREGGIRFDTKDGAFAEGDSGERAIVSGNSKESELIRRILSDDSSEMMPPMDHQKPLSKSQKELLVRWIQSGAEYQDHWAFVPLKEVKVPSKKSIGRPNIQWTKNPIDRFVLKKLMESELKPEKPESAQKLLRRVYLDVTGVPPTESELTTFNKNSSQKKWNETVSRLFQSPRYGEHQARFWLDAARYGDTHGLHLDNYREMWPYRDWVIQAYNKNMPYDQFLTEQIAGDLLPNSTLSQKIATGFVRAHVTTNEGGSIVEEVEVRNVVDRTTTVGTVFMGLTMDCSRCHDHKFDPISMKEFYSFYAFFNSVEGNPMDGNRKDHAPVLKLPSTDQKKQLDSLKTQIVSLNKQKSKIISENLPNQPIDWDVKTRHSKAQPFVWFDDQLPAGALATSDDVRQKKWLFSQDTEPVFSGKRSAKKKAIGVKQQFFVNANEPIFVDGEDELFAYVFLDPNDPPKQIMLQWNDGSWEHRAYWGEARIPFGKNGTTSQYNMGELPETGKWIRLSVKAKTVALIGSKQVHGMAFTQFGGTVFWDSAGVVSRNIQTVQSKSNFSLWLARQRSKPDPNLPAPLKKKLKTAKIGKLPPSLLKGLKRHFAEFISPKVQTLTEKIRKKQAATEKRKKKLESQIPLTLICKEMKSPKDSFVLNRGQYDQKGQKVSRQTPSFLPKMDESLPKNRLGIAKWLTAPNHPLTARVEVNRIWQQFFGTGLVKTSEDFGSQGEVPSHPKLLDFLAAEFIRSGWNRQHIIRMIICSQTYQQRAFSSKDKLAKDPYNRLLSRGPRHRLDGETLRDQALYLSGLLVEKVGGPGVKPPQPDTWFAVAYTNSNTQKFKADKGADKVHRRSLYTFIKRTAPPPQMATFDGPSRESVCVRRERTNTPLQALLLLNDPQFLRCYKAFGQRMLTEIPENNEKRLDSMWFRATGRSLENWERAELLRLVEDQKTFYLNNPKLADKLLSDKEWKKDPNLESCEVAAWTIVASLILNSDEVLNK